MDPQSPQPTNPNDSTGGPSSAGPTMPASGSTPAPGMEQSSGALGTSTNQPNTMPGQPGTSQSMQAGTGGKKSGKAIVIMIIIAVLLLGAIGVLVLR